MSGRKVIASKYLPSRIPIWTTAVLWLLLDRFHVHGVLAGVIWTVWVILVLIVILDMFTAEQYAPFTIEKPK